MKKNTRKILLFLYPTADSVQAKPEEKPLLSFEQLRFLLPKLSTAGFKSLLFYLEKNDYLFKQELDKEVYYSLTNYGRDELERQFPALSIARRQWHGEWTVIIFLQAIKSDQNFRYLRTFLLKHACIALTRGVFLFPGQLNDLVLAELNNRYRQGVMVYQLGNRIIGEERIIIGQKISLADGLKIYSSISRELDELIEITAQIKSLRDQHKLTFYSIFDRFEAFLQEDSGLIQHYYPQVEGALSILNRLQKALKI
jgi:DNA-binding transcriptional regulator PaaX